MKDPSLEKCLALLTKAKICISCFSYVPVIPYNSQHFQQKCIYMLTKMSISMFIVALLTVEWENTLWDTMEQYTETKITSYDYMQQLERLHRYSVEQKKSNIRAQSTVLLKVQE